MAKIKSFGNFIYEYYNEETGNEVTPNKYAHLNKVKEQQGVKIYKGSDQTKPDETVSSAAFPKMAAEWLADGVTLITITGFENSWFTKYDVAVNRCNINPKYQSEVNGTWGDETLPLFMDEHEDYDEVNFDITKVEPNTVVHTKKNGQTLVGAIFIKDKDGNEFAVHAHTLDEVFKGGSIEDDVIPGSTYMIDKMKARIVNYIKMPGEKEGIIVVKMQNGARVRYSLSDFRSEHYPALDESEEFVEEEDIFEAKVTAPKETNKAITKELEKKIVEAAKLTEEFATLQEEFNKKIEPIRNTLNKHNKEVIALMKELNASQIVVKKVIAKMEVTKGKTTDSYKALYEKCLSMLNQNARNTMNAFRDATKKFNPDKFQVKYETNEAVSDIITKLTDWVSSWWNSFKSSAEEYNESVEALEAVVAASTK